MTSFSTNARARARRYNGVMGEHADSSARDEPGGAPQGSGGLRGAAVETVRAAVAERFAADVLPALERYTSIECLSPAFDPAWSQRGEIARAAALLESWARERAIARLSAEVVELPGRTPVLLCEIPATDPARASSTTLLYGHFDKQPPLGAWRPGLAPFVAVREGDRLYGRGTADDGYATFAALTAVEALERAGAAHGRVVLLVESSEESGSPDLGQYLDALAPRLAGPSLVVCLDSSCVTYDRLWVTTSLRGNLVCEVRADVLGSGVHSGLAGGIVPSSFRVLRSLLDRVEDASTGALLLPELRAEVPGRRRAEIAELASEFGEAAAGSFPTVPGLELSGASAAERVELGTWAGSLAVTGAEGLPALRDGGNVVRPYTTLKLSIRLPPRADPEAARRAIERALTVDPPAGARVQVTFEAPASGWEAPELSPGLAAALEAASIAGFGVGSRSVGIGGSIPFVSELGARYRDAQFVVTGVLGPESNAHGPDEFLHLPCAESLTVAVASLLAGAP